MVCQFDLPPSPFHLPPFPQGQIVLPRGPPNFGWDPIFQPEGFQQTYAELDSAVKNTISHRYKALVALREHFVGERREKPPPAKRAKKGVGGIRAVKQQQKGKGSREESKSGDSGEPRTAGKEGIGDKTDPQLPEDSVPESKEL